MLHLADDIMMLVEKVQALADTERLREIANKTVEILDDDVLDATIVAFGLKNRRPHVTTLLPGLVGARHGTAARSDNTPSLDRRSVPQ